jgi:hypothetical protein
MRIGYIIDNREKITYELMWERLDLSAKYFTIYFVGFGIKKLNPLLYYKHNLPLKNMYSIVPIMLER